jgi:hypothetical protein
MIVGVCGACWLQWSMDRWLCDVPRDLWAGDSLLLWNCWKCFQRSLGTLAQPRGRPRSPESATQLTGCERQVSWSRGRRGGSAEWSVGSGECLGVRECGREQAIASRGKEHEYLATTNDCLPGREQGSGAGSCVSTAAGADHLLPEWGSGQSIIHS